jgi:mono/diheme cytochrome c family protein
MRKPLLAAQALVLTFAGIVPASGQEAGTVAAGRALALEVCASCHVVSADQGRAPRPKTQDLMKEWPEEATNWPLKTRRADFNIL